MKLILFLALTLLGANSFAQDSKEPIVTKPSKTFKSIDGSYDVEVAEATLHRCGKENLFMDYLIYENANKACAITYKKLKCTTKENPCPLDKWEVIQEEKVIATARSSAQFCTDKAAQLTEKFKVQGFDCKAESVRK